MSNVQTQTAVAKPVTISSSVKKAFAAVNIEAIVNGKLPFDDGELCKPSLIRCDKDSARAALGGKINPVSITTGLLFLTAAHAFGQGKIAVLSEGLPPASVYLLAQACAPIKHGAGTSVASLKTAVLCAIGKMLELPTATKAVKAVENKTEADKAEVIKYNEGKIAPLPDVVKATMAADKYATYGVPHAMATDGDFNPHHGIAVKRTACLEGLAKIAEEKITASRIAAEKAPKLFVNEFAVILKDNPTQAFALLAEMQAMVDAALKKAA